MTGKNTFLFDIPKNNNLNFDFTDGSTTLELCRYFRNNYAAKNTSNSFKVCSDV